LVYILVDRLVFAVVVCLVHILIDEFYACRHCMFGCLVHILIDEFYSCCCCMLGCLVYILVDRLVFDTVWVLVIYIY